MSVTISRTAWIDDDGTGTTGTVINNAVKTSLYNEIDFALTKVAQLTGGNNFVNDQTVTGNIAWYGNSYFMQATVGGPMQFNVRNPFAAAVNTAEISLGIDTQGRSLILQAIPSGYSSNGIFQANGGVFISQGTGGLSVGSFDAAPFRLCSYGTERMQITAAGEVLINTKTNPSGNAVFLVVDQAAHALGIGIQNANSGNSLYYLAFYNSAGGGIGTVSQVNASSVAYNTTSDQRLKTDRGHTIDLTELRAVIVHDFTWIADARPDRGVFAQEAHGSFPRAITKGNDERNEGGELARPWMTDYSKFVPDLIVGWQQHDTAITELRALLATLKGSPDAQ